MVVDVQSNAVLEKRIKWSAKKEKSCTAKDTPLQILYSTENNNFTANKILLPDFQWTLIHKIQCKQRRPLWSNR